MLHFYHISARLPSWSCDLDHLYKLSCSLLTEASHEIWLDWQAISEIFDNGGRRRNTADDGRQSMDINHMCSSCESGGPGEGKKKYVFINSAQNVDYGYM